jgi:hypothetical protein
MPWWQGPCHDLHHHNTSLFLPWLLFFDCLILKMETVHPPKRLKQLAHQHRCQNLWFRNGEMCLTYILHQWRTQEFCWEGGGGFNKFNLGQGAERAGIWGQYPPSHGFRSICKWLKPVFVLGCYGCIFQRIGNSAQICQNFGISGGGGGVWNPQTPPLVRHWFAQWIERCVVWRNLRESRCYLPVTRTVTWMSVWIRKALRQVIWPLCFPGYSVLTHTLNWRLNLKLLLAASHAAVQI